MIKICTMDQVGSFMLDLNISDGFYSPSVLIPMLNNCEQSSSSPSLSTPQNGKICLERRVPQVKILFVNFDGI